MSHNYNKFSLPSLFHAQKRGKIVHTVHCESFALISQHQHFVVNGERSWLPLMRHVCESHVDWTQHKFPAKLRAFFSSGWLFVENVSLRTWRSASATNCKISRDLLASFSKRDLQCHSFLQQRKLN